MLGVGIDWAEQFHLVALGRPGEGVLEVVQVGHSPRAVDALVDKIVELEPDPAEVRVVLETRHGLLVDRLVDAGFVVLPVNPDLISRRRGPAKKKDDAEDARICCLLALDRFAGLRPLIPHGPVASELRAIARDDERAARDERRLLNRLRADLLTVFPAAVAIGGENMGAPTFLRMLAQWPTAEALGAVSRDELIAWARAQRSGYGERFAERVQTALAAEQFPSPRSSGPRQGRHHPAGRRPAAADRRPAAGLGTADERAATRPAPSRQQRYQPGRQAGARTGAGVSWRRDLPQLSGSGCSPRRQDRW